MISRRVLAAAALVVAFGGLELARADELQAREMAGCAACLAGVQCENEQRAEELCDALACTYVWATCGNFGNCQPPAVLLGCYGDET